MEEQGTQGAAVVQPGTILRKRAAVYAAAYVAAYEIVVRYTDPGNAHFAALRALDLAAKQ
jgi:hypothetical protein